jgi:magnesium transporter
MKTFFAIQNGALTPADPGPGPIVVYASPDNGEKRELLETLDQDRHDLESALDPEEIPRLDVGPHDTYIIWKRPSNVTVAQQLKFEVSSVGLFLERDRLTIILGDQNPPFAGREFQRVGSLNDVVLRFFLHTVRHYLGHLRAIKQISADLQAKLNRSMENRYLLQMFTLSESLIYYQNAIEANTAVLTKLRANAERIGLSADEVESLDDILIEHQQCLRQTQIFSSVLSGLMDARGNIINNNMNVLLKNLTLINVVFLPLNLIAGIGGMSEYSLMTHGIDWRISYALFLVAMGALGLLTWRLLVGRISRRPRE